MSKTNGLEIVGAPQKVPQKRHKVAQKYRPVINLDEVEDAHVIEWHDSYSDDSLGKILADAGKGIVGALAQGLATGVIALVNNYRAYHRSKSLRRAGRAALEDKMADVRRYPEAYGRRRGGTTVIERTIETHQVVHEKIIRHE